MLNHLSVPHLFVASALVLLAGGLGLVAENPLGAVYALIASAVVASRALDGNQRPVPVTVRIEP